MTVYVIAGLCFLMHIGFGGGKITMSLSAIDLGASALAIGQMMSIMALLPTLIAVPLGRLTDRTGVRIPMIIGLTGILIAILTPFAFPSVTALFVMAALIGGSFTFFQVAVTNLIGALGPPEKRSHNYGMLSLGFAGASFVGPLVAGFSIDHFGHRHTFALLAVWIALPLALIVFKRNLVPNMRVPKSERHSGSVMDLLRMRKLRDTFIAGGVLSSAWDLYQFLLPLYGHYIGLSASVIGMILSAFAVAILVVRVLLPLLARRYTDGQLITAAILVSGAAYLMFPAFTSPWLLAAVSFVLGLGVGAGQPLSLTLIYNLAPPGRAGEASGVRVSVNHMTHVAVPLAFGGLGAVVGFAPLFFANAAILLASGWVSSRKYLK